MKKQVCLTYLLDLNCFNQGQFITLKSESFECRIGTVTQKILYFFVISLTVLTIVDFLKRK